MVLVARAGLFALGAFALCVALVACSGGGATANAGATLPPPSFPDARMVERIRVASAKGFEPRQPVEVLPVGAGNANALVALIQTHCAAWRRDYDGPMLSARPASKVTVLFDSAEARVLSLRLGENFVEYDAGGGSLYCHWESAAFDRAVELLRLR
jgi:hypothetical protein